MSSLLKDQGWIKVSEKIPPRGEPILLGELIDGVLHTFHSEITRPYKNSKTFPDCFYYKRKEYLHYLISDMYWKDENGI